MAAATKARTADVARAIWKSRTVVVANVRVNDTNTLNEMRAALSQKDHGMKFVKNSIARKAVEDFEDRKLLGNLLHGQVFLIHSNTDDGVSALKAAADLASTYPSVALLGAAVDNTLLTTEGITAATKLPSLETLHGDLIGSLLGPSYQLASTLEAPKINVAATLARSLEAPSRDAVRALEQTSGRSLAASLAGREAQLGDDKDKDS
jgi:ribosomal protein L10